jgi:acylphosphatase
MRAHNPLNRRSPYIVAAFLSCTLVTLAPARDAKVAAVSGVVTGNVQQVGFRAMIQKQAIAYNLAGSAENNSDKSVHFVLQGADDRIDQVLAAIRKGTKKSSDVKVSTAAASVDLSLKTFTVVGWTSLSRGISQSYDLVFDLRPDDTTITKGKAKKVWLGICEKAVKGDDIGKCAKDKDDE